MEPHSVVFPIRWPLGRSDGENCSVVATLFFLFRFSDVALGGGCCGPRSREFNGELIMFFPWHETYCVQRRRKLLRRFVEQPHRLELPLSAAGRGLSQSSFEPVEDPFEDPIVDGSHLQNPDRYEPPCELGVQHVCHLTALGGLPDFESVRAFDKPLVGAPNELPVALELAEDRADDPMAFPCLIDHEWPRGPLKRDLGGGPQLIAVSPDLLESAEHLRRGS